jgi:hypothetical protein
MQKKLETKENVNVSYNFLYTMFCIKLMVKETLNGN